ncbi:MAG: hypothetical protein N2C12_14385 [Planctomycetales bacterium]
MRYQLVGYVLGALDDAERRELERQIADDSRMQVELELVRRAVEPLSVAKSLVAPPNGLAQRTCDLIDSQYREPSTGRQLQPATASATIAEDMTVTSRRHRWSMVDLAVAAGIVIAATMLLFPMVSHSRFQSHVSACQNNLATIGQAIQTYGRDHQGRIPEIPQQGSLAVAGVYSTRLIEAGLVENPQTFVCSGSELGCSGTPIEIPEFGELAKLAANGDSRLDEILSNVGGSYAYNLGYLEDDRYCTVSLNDGSNSHKVLLADAPGKNLGWKQSNNHGGEGQNALYADGHVRYLTSCRNPLCVDGDIFHNNDGKIAAGMNDLDMVVGQSTVRP